MENNNLVAEAVFFLTLIATFGVAFFARRHSRIQTEDGLAGRSLNRWLVGLSAGTTANSGFIVTAAVGLGYSFGLQWLMLPLSWLLGDLVFWHFFPKKINQFGRSSQATTLSEMLVSGLSGKTAKLVCVLSAVIIVVCLAGYTSAQWLAGQKFLAGAFGFNEYSALILFAVVIIGYSSIGGFIGSIYTDTFQAVIRILGTILALVAVIYFALDSPSDFAHNISLAGKDFLNPFPGGTLVTIIGFIFGFAAAAIGFGLGQPQLVSRYLAGSSPAETGAAKWIYIGFVQFTWISMTGFGVLLRGVMPDIADPETGLSIFFKTNMHAIATGIIVADIFATIASTSNSLLVAMTQAVLNDLTSQSKKGISKLKFGVTCFVIGLVTMVLSSMLHGTVLSLALTSVSLMGAGLAAAVMIKVLGWKHTSHSIAGAICVGLAAAIAWRMAGYGAIFNEAGIGIAFGVLTNYVINLVRKKTT
jgi:sodium/proline symporter